MRVPIDDHKGLARDIRTRAIINTNKSALQQARARKKAILERDAKQNELEQSVDQLNNRLDRIEELLKTLVEKA